VAAKIVDRERKLNLIVTQPEKGRFIVLDRQCTHSGGQVAYNRGRRTVQCTCWGHSEFSLRGDVLGGPAKRPLRVYPARVRDGKLEILCEAAR
jgi:menaquinol-cytochrome c reductase iron-sulfur subunit